MLSTTRNSGSTAAAAAVMPSDTAYAARRSQHVGDDAVATDGDIWQEKLAVCEGSTDAGEPRLLIRSYYRNSRTQDRVWDEPPSGAGTVLHANSEMRSKAEAQKQELQMLLDMIPPEDEELEGEGKESDSNNKAKKKGLFGRFARKKKKGKKQVDASRDLNLQRAIARSMMEQTGGNGGDDDFLIYYDDGVPSAIMQGQQSSGSSSKQQQEDEELELAKALSMSVETAAREANGGNINLTEEEMFQRALEKSRDESMRQEGNGVASRPEPSWLHDSSTSLTASPQASVKKGVKSDPNEDSEHDDRSNLKLPAAPGSIKQFDPYS